MLGFSWIWAERTRMQLGSPTEGSPTRGGLLLVLTLLAAVGGVACAGGEESSTATNSTGKTDAGKDAQDPTDARQDVAADVETDGGDSGPTECVPKTCAQLEANCGSAPDGCGDKIECGECPSGQTCGGGGTNKCGTDECTPKSCVQVSAQCGWASDGCAEAIDCGGCATPEVCGGGGKVNECGCAPKTCSQLGASCGSLPDGCEGTLNCGECSGGGICGGGGGPNTCGSNECVAKTCVQVGASCGYTSDGCSKAINCGKCTDPEVCGGGGEENQCGCTPKTCVQMGANCGMVDTGCGSENCGACTAPDTCGGGGLPNVCGCTCTLPNAVTNCLGGVCTIKSCNAGWADCDGASANGCEANLNADVANCGTCNTVCGTTNGASVCLSGSCVITCDVGFANCDGDPSNGCEAQFSSDPNNCGACHQPCSPNHVEGLSCVNAVCIGTCEAGFEDCNGDLRTDGCEADTATDPTNCGSCGALCSDAHVPVPQCAGGVCDGACETDFADCNGDKLADGCETDTTSDTSHCGSCANDCTALPNTATVECSAGDCGIVACTANYYDQDQAVASGCECADDGVANACGTAANLGTIALTATTKPTATTYYSLVPTGDTDWFKGTFSPNASTCAQRPRVTLVDPSGMLRMRLYATQTCTPGPDAGYTCTEGGDSADATGFTSWELGHSGACADLGTIDPTPGLNGQYIQANNFLIEVFAVGTSTDCLPYQLAFTRY